MKKRYYLRAVKRLGTVVTDDGHTLLKEDIVLRLNSLTATNKELLKKVKELEK